MNQRLIRSLLSLLPLFLWTSNLLAQLTLQRKQLFDDRWKFNLGDVPGIENAPTESWRTVDLPHDWSIEGRVNPGNPMGGDGGFFPDGIGWYSKKFEVPLVLKNKRISVYFEGVYMNSEVFLNGKPLGKYPYGYSAFSYDLSPGLNYGGTNTLSVRVDNSQQKNSRWYSGSGIYRHVWITVTDPVHVDRWGTFISTSDVSTEKALVSVKTHVRNESPKARTLTVKTVLRHGAAKNAPAAETKILVPANSGTDVSQQIAVYKPALWNPASPALYEAETTLSSAGKELDRQVTSFGIRALRFSVTDGFQLNGKTLKLNGGCVHHDNGCLGAAAYDRAEERRVELLKAAGFNAVRTSHNPPSEAFLDACDRLGMLVIDEAFDGWRESKSKFDYSALYFDQWWKRDLETMVLRDRNHPSIIVWSTGNEIIERKKPGAVETAKMLVDAIHRLDTTRPVTSALTTWDRTWEIYDPLAAAHDIVGYNYQLHRAEADHARVPSRIMVQTESYPNDAFANWKLVKEHPYVLGDFVWTALDYLGESGIGRWYYSGESASFHSNADLFPWHGAYCGDVDLVGWRKPISHYRSMLYNEEEKLYMAVREPAPEPLEIKTTGWAVWPTWESWTWPGFEEKSLDVEVYSKYPRVRLYLNDRLIGEKETLEPQQFKAVFSTPYTSGVLKAVGLLNGKETGELYLKTAGKTAKISLLADRETIMANGQDLSFIRVELTDAEGTLQPNADNRLSFSIEGPGSIVGVDNANLKDVDPYVATSRKAWHGRAMVVIKSGRETGNVRLKVSAPGLAGAELLIRTTERP